jgi:hypothetical protein
MRYLLGPVRYVVDITMPVNRGAIVVRAAITVGIGRDKWMACVRA